MIGLFWRRKVVAPNPMVVRRVSHSESGSHIEPPLNKAWPELDQLRWKAALATLDSGQKVSVQRSDYNVRTPYYDIRCDYSVSGPLCYDEVWVFLNGFETGAYAATRRLSDLDDAEKVNDD